jgi:hypothetical protein
MKSDEKETSQLLDIVIMQAFRAHAKADLHGYVLIATGDEQRMCRTLGDDPLLLDLFIDAMRENPGFRKLAIDAIDNISRQG